MAKYLQKITWIFCSISSLQFSCSVTSNSFWPHEPQHARPNYPSPTPRVHPNPYPLSWWCHPTISSSVVPLSSCVICIFEVIDMSPSNLNSSLRYIHSAFCMMYSAYKLNKQGDNIQLWHTPFPIFYQSVVPSPVLTVASWLVYSFLRRQVKRSGICTF